MENMLIVFDKRMREPYLAGLRRYFRHSELMPFFMDQPLVYRSIANHPDIYFFQVGWHTMVHAPGVDMIFLEKLRSSGVCLIPGEKDPSGEYPSTALYNAARVGNKVFLNKKYSDRVVLDTIRERGLSIIDVPQGYTRCSVLAVSDRALITSDKKISFHSRKNGFEALEILPGHVLLPGEKHGFIGGAGGLTLDGKVFLAGDIRRHPQGQEIEKFISANSKGLINLDGLELCDLGSFFFLGCSG